MTPKRLLAALLFVLAGCAAADYTGALNRCLADHIGDPAGRAQCECDVSKDAGRSCDWIGKDAGAE